MTLQHRESRAPSAFNHPLGDEIHLSVQFSDSLESSKAVFEDANFAGYKHKLTISLFRYKRD